MSIIRVGLGENKKFGAGYEAIFGKKDVEDKEAPAADKSEAGQKKPAAKKTTARKKK